MIKILLTGKSGQLSNEIIKDAKDFGSEVFSFTKEELDIENKNAVEEKIKEIKPNIFINTAAYHVLSKCQENPFMAMSINFLAVASLADLCKKYEVKFATYSTDYVFDGQKGSLYNEEDTPHPLQIYGISKLAGEYAALNIYPKNTFIIRTCGLYGGKTGSPEKGGNFVLNIIKQAVGKEKIEVSSEQIVSPTYAGDLSKASLKLLTHENALPGIYNLVNDGFCSWHEFAEEIFKLLNINTKVVPINRGGSFEDIKKPTFSALECIKAKSIGINMPNWKEGLKSYLKEIS